MVREITITTGARLHFGLLAHGRTSGREFGGAGLIIDSPGVRITARPADRDSVNGPTPDADRVCRFVATYRDRCPAAKVPPPARIDVERALPPHSGLGSGTQLGMAVAQALALLAGDGDASPAQLAQRVGRGLRSSLGIHGFGRGGFLVEAGKTRPEQIGTLVAHADFPEAWRLVLVAPGDEAGLSGRDEVRAFDRLPPMPLATTERLCHIALTELLPSVLEADFAACGESLYGFGRLVGESFAPVQGGTYASRSMAALVEHLRSSGVRGVGQTSWGPTIFALTPDEPSARQLAGGLQADSRWPGCRCHVAKPLNTGAALEVR